MIVSTKTGLPMGDGPGDAGTSRSRLITACENALRRLGTDRIDLFQLHAYDAGAPVEEVLSALDDLVRAGKVRYVGISNFSGWQAMKSLASAEKYGRPRYVAHQVYYSLIGRDYEWELMPLGLDQGLGALVWSPLGWGRLTGKIRRGRPLPANTSRRSIGPPAHALGESAALAGRTVGRCASADRGRRRGTFEMLTSLMLGIDEAVRAYPRATQ